MAEQGEHHLFQRSQWKAYRLTTHDHQMLGVVTITGATLVVDAEAVERVQLFVVWQWDTCFTFPQRVGTLHMRDKFRVRRVMFGTFQYRHGVEECHAGCDDKSLGR